MDLVLVKTVLVVEDEPTLVATLRYNLGREGRCNRDKGRGGDSRYAAGQPRNVHRSAAIPGCAVSHLTVAIQAPAVDASLRRKRARVSSPGSDSSRLRRRTRFGPWPKQSGRDNGHEGADLQGY